MTSQDKDLTGRHKDLTSQHNYLTSEGRNMPPHLSYSEDNIPTTAVFYLQGVVNTTLTVRNVSGSTILPDIINPLILHAYTLDFT